MLTKKTISIEGLSEYFSSCRLHSDYIQKWIKPQPILPLITIPPTNKYEGLSLEEIEDKFGKEEAQKVYWYCTQGIDLTKPQKLPPSIFKNNTIEVVKWSISVEYNERYFQYNYEVNVFPSPHRKTTQPLRTISKESIIAEAFEEFKLIEFCGFTLERLGFGSIVEAKYVVQECGKWGNE